MPGKIRVHELAKELQLTNQQTLDLCVALSIGVKSHSSSIVEAQADRVRRRAENDGLLRPEPAEAQAGAPAGDRDGVGADVVAGASAEEPATETQAGKSRAPKIESRKPAFEPAAESEAVESEPAEKPPANPEATRSAPAVTTKQSAAEAVAAGAGSRRAAVDPRAGAAAREAPASPPPVTAGPRTAAPRTAAPSTKATISSSGSVAPPRRAPKDETRRPEPAPQSPPVKPAAPAPAKPPQGAPPPRPGKAASPPVSRSGKPIPPPPPPRRFHPPASAQPPQSRGGGPSSQRRPPTGAARPAAPDRPAGARRGAPAPSSGPRPTGGPRPGAAAPGARPGAKSGPGGKGGPGGSQRRPPRRKSRRRRVREELQPIDIPAYTPLTVPVPEGTVVVERASAAQDFGPKLNRTAADVVRFLMQHGEGVTATQSLSDDMMELFAAEVGADIRLVNPGEEQEAELQKLLGVADDAVGDAGEAPLRPPVVTVMGHVDHGKTLLLDRIRDTHVVDGEAGGITQHIGAYQVERNGRPVTFIDTPGHEAFTAMRARGAGATDIVVLVVAADDGVMPQTIEAINHARAAEVPIVVAVNKIDRPNADTQRTVAGVAEQGLVPEAWGGETIYSEVSALTGEGVDELLDQMLLVAEVEELRASPEGRARGVVLESNLDIGRGPVATVLVQKGTLRIGDPMVAGASWGRVRALLNDRGEAVEQAAPSTPVQVLGLSEVAGAGDIFAVAPNEKVAGRVADIREHWQRLSSLGREAHALSGGAKLEDLFTRIQRGETATLNAIVKADVNGSLEAVVESLRKLETGEVRIAVVHRG
ncbi:MAG: translation initiation factor IF-2, partial [Acidimicrobiaceae bacterium]|nr:translation initiation factor IF-2 [Acidimicrobiaceae bacterium]